MNSSKLTRYEAHFAFGCRHGTKYSFLSGASPRSGQKENWTKSRKLSIFEKALGSMPKGAGQLHPAKLDKMTKVSICKKSS
jgi:hypothetical protein